MATENLLFVISHSPRHSNLALESLDAALTAALLGSEINVLLLGDGIDLLSDGEGREKLASIQAIGTVHTHVATRDSEFLPAKINHRDLNFTVVDDKTVTELFQRHRKIMSF